MSTTPERDQKAFVTDFFDTIPQGLGDDFAEAARVYAAAVSMMVVLVASWPLFGVPISAQVAISIVTVALSMVQYHLPPSFDRDFDRGVS